MRLNSFDLKNCILDGNAYPRTPAKEVDHFGVKASKFWHPEIRRIVVMDER